MERAMCHGPPYLIAFYGESGPSVGEYEIGPRSSAAPKSKEGRGRRLLLTTLENISTKALGLRDNHVICISAARAVQIPRPCRNHYQPSHPTD